MAWASHVPGDPAAYMEGCPTCPMWMTTLGGSGTQTVHDLLVEGSYAYVTGSSGGKAPVVRIDGGGNAVTVTTLPPDGNGVGNALASHNGLVAIAGQVSNRPVRADGQAALAVVGGMATETGGAGQDEFRDVAWSGDKIVAVGRQFSGNDYDVLVAAYSTGGTLLWKHVVDIGGHDLGRFVAVVDNRVVVGAESGHPSRPWLVLGYDLTTGASLWSPTLTFVQWTGQTHPLGMAVEGSRVTMAGILDWKGRNDAIIAQWDLNGNYRGREVYAGVAGDVADPCFQSHLGMSHGRGRVFAVGTSENLGICESATLPRTFRDVPERVETPPQGSSMVTAIDGATGRMLWRHDVAPGIDGQGDIAFSADVHPGGHILAVVGVTFDAWRHQQVFIQGFDASTGAVLGRVVMGGGHDDGGTLGDSAFGWPQIAWSPTGSHLVVTYPTGSDVIVAGVPGRALSPFA